MSDEPWKFFAYTATCCHEQLPQNTDPKNCRNMVYMQESCATAAYHVNTIAAQQVALQHVARQSRPV